MINMCKYYISYFKIYSEVRKFIHEKMTIIFSKIFLNFSLTFLYVCGESMDGFTEYHIK